MVKRWFFGARKRGIASAANVSILLCLMLLSSCDSSDTRSTVKNSTSGEFQLQARIVAPVSGSIIEITGGSTNVTFTSSVSGGTEPIGLTWNLRGPTMSNTATGDSPTITILEPGLHTVSLTARDSRGLTGSDSITVTFTVGGSVTTTSTTTTSTTTSTTTTIP